MKPDIAKVYAAANDWRKVTGYKDLSLFDGKLKLVDFIGIVEMIPLKKRDGDDLVSGCKKITHQPLKEPQTIEETTWHMRIPNFYTDHADLAQNKA